MNKPKTPDRIYLFEAGEGIQWCEDAAPGIDMNEEDAVEYVRVDAANPAQRGAPTDADIQLLWGAACKDTPQNPGWNRHIRFARALLARYAPAQNAEREKDADHLANYRWLRDHFEDVYAVDAGGNLVLSVKGAGLPGESADALDNAIRAARAQRAEGETQE